MEIRLDINTRVVDWLASMGYPVSGMPVQILRGMLLREARQWQISPEQLESMILDGSRPSANAFPGSPSLLLDAQSIAREGNSFVPRASGRAARLSH